MTRGGSDFDLIIKTVEEAFRCTASSSVKSKVVQLTHLIKLNFICSLRHDLKVIERKTPK